MYTQRPVADIGLKAERIDAPFPIFRVDSDSLLPVGWVAEIRDRVSVFAEYSCLSGESPTSRQKQLGDFGDHPVGVVTGKVVVHELPWLSAFYHERVLTLANNLELGEFVASPDVRSAVNVNILPPGSGYEWHVDSNPLTGLLFVTGQSDVTGGELVFRPDPLSRAGEDWELTIRPEAGVLLLFDAREAAHAVQPVHGTVDRISVPMNFYYAGAGSNRPDCLDQYLYGQYPAAV
jgi:hypothetical protein